MSTYDTVELDGKVGQVKCFGCTLAYYTTGKQVPPLGGKDVYSIAMREGGFVNVVGGRLVSWTEKPLSSYVLDKYGHIFGTGTRGLRDEAYFYR